MALAIKPAVARTRRFLRTTAVRLSLLYLLVFTLISVSMIVYVGRNASELITRDLRATIDRLAPGGVLAIWAAQREPDLLARLQQIASAQETVAELVLPVAREGRSFDYAIYLVERSGA